MKQQVSRLSPHQNGKVFGVLMALGSLVFVVPFMLVMTAFTPAGGEGSPPLLMFLVMPVIYLVFGYLSVAIGCALYNFMFKYLGGIEYESKGEESA
jgi:hypothetical protein